VRELLHPTNKHTGEREASAVESAEATREKARENEL